MDTLPKELFVMIITYTLHQPKDIIHLPSISLVCRLSSEICRASSSRVMLDALKHDTTMSVCTSRESVSFVSTGMCQDTIIWKCFDGKDRGIGNHISLVLKPLGMSSIIRSINITHRLLQLSISCRLTHVLLTPYCELRYVTIRIGKWCIGWQVKAGDEHFSLSEAIRYTTTDEPLHIDEIWKIMKIVGYAFHINRSHFSI